MDQSLLKSMFLSEYFGIIALILITVLLALAVDFWQQTTESWKLAIQIPGPRPFPLIGNAHMALGLSCNEIYETAKKLGNFYGPISRGFLGYKVLVFLCDPRDAEVILGSSVHLTKSSEYRFFKPWLGDGLLISDGEKWRSHRKLIVPAFHQYVLKSFVGAFNRNSWKTVKRMQNEIGNEFDVHDYMSAASVDILLETAMGQTKRLSDREGFDYAMAVMKLCEIIHLRQFTFYMRVDAIFKLFKLSKIHNKLIKHIHDVTERVFRSKIEKLKDILQNGKALKPIYPSLVSEEPERYMDSEKEADDMKYPEQDSNKNDIGGKNRLAFLDLMIESTYCGANITEEEIKEEVNTIMFEGHDTTAAASSFVLCLLACHPDVQEKVYDEQQAIFGDVKRAATFADTLQMNYLERVILETLRLYPPVPVVAREVHENVKLVSQPLTIPSGATVVIGTYQIHRQKDVYENPDKFDPDNFLPERTQHRHFYSYIPFSAGPRNCVGRKYAMLKLKILLSTICRNYYIKSSVEEKDFKLQGDIILKRTDGFRIQIESRTA